MLKSLFEGKNSSNYLLKSNNFSKLIDEINNFKILRSSSENLLEHHDRNMKIGSNKGIHVNHYLNNLHRYEMSKLFKPNFISSTNSFYGFFNKINNQQALYTFAGILILNAFIIYM